MKISGHWFEPENSTRQEAYIELAGKAYSLVIDEQVQRSGSTQDISVSDRLGKMPRRLTWDDDAVFETTANEDVDVWLSEYGETSGFSLAIHRMESSWRWAAASIVIVAFVAFASFKWGIPAASEAIAERLPHSINKTVSRQALVTMDRLIFQESELDEQKQAEVQAQFDQLLAELPIESAEYELHFRDMFGMPNAMALPGGDIVVTDAFVNMVEHPQELDSVLLHEIGHVEHHHGMTQVIQASAVSIIVTLAFGDMSAIGEVAVGVPIFLMQNSYSRLHESEADSYAFENMLSQGKDPKYFASIITRLTMTDFDLDNPTDPDPDRGQPYFSSHPNSADRARRALQASQRAESP